MRASPIGGRQMKYKVVRDSDHPSIISIAVYDGSSRARKGGGPTWEETLNALLKHREDLKQVLENLATLRPPAV